MHPAPIRAQGNIVRKAVVDPSGRLALVTFYVFEQGGRVRARVIDVEVLKGPAIGQVALALPGRSCCAGIPSGDIASQPVESPYFHTDIYVSGSKPRAPSLG